MVEGWTPMLQTFYFSTCFLFEFFISTDDKDDKSKNGNFELMWLFGKALVNDQLNYGFPCVTFI